MMRLELQFTAEGGRNYLSDVDGNIRAYCEAPKESSEAYGYLTIKRAIIDTLTAAGIADKVELEFWWDGQEQFLDADASAECDVVVEIDPDFLEEMKA